MSRALQVLGILREAPNGLSLLEIGDRSGLTKGTSYRLLATLAQSRFVERVDGRYRIGIGAFLVGNAFLAHLDLRARALPHLVHLRNQSGETVQMAVLYGFQVVYIDRVLSHSPVAYMRSRAGVVLPAYCTALGKVLLAFSPDDLIHRYLAETPLTAHTPLTIVDRDQFLEELATIRRRGYGIDRGERELAVQCIAAPIFSHEQAVVAAVSVAGPADRMPSPLEGSPLASWVVDAGLMISAAIGYPLQTRNS